jgi:hypothetical protein
MSSEQLDGPAETPYREIRALYNSDTITVYQAYASPIAIAAVEQQKLNASKDWSGTRMTWIKPSWCWMMYRSGYSYKDKRQARILAIKMRREHFEKLLSYAVLTTHNTPASSTPDAVPDESAADQSSKDRKPVRQKNVESTEAKVQWDPERDHKLLRLDYRSIQIGVPPGLCDKWVNEWIVEIEDVTEKATALKKTLDEQPDINIDELKQKGLVPHERPYELSEELKMILHAS